MYGKMTGIVKPDNVFIMHPGNKIAFRDKNISLQLAGSCRV